VIALPLLAPERNDTSSGPLELVVDPDTVFTSVGFPGTVAGVTATESADDAPVPTALTAATLNRYEVPFVRPANSYSVVAEPTRRAVVPVTPLGAPPEAL